MQVHNDSPATCEICGKTSANHRALREHKRLSHRPLKLKCSICGNLFRQTQTLREHMAMHTGQKDLYSCPFCTKTFRSKANMYKHKKHGHPIEVAEQKAVQFQSR